MSEIITERTGRILRIQLNRPAKNNAMLAGMYEAMADILDDSAKDDDIRVVVLHAAGSSFCVGKDVEEFMEKPAGPGESPKAGLTDALVKFDKPLIAAVQGAARDGGATMLLHCDFVYAGESATFQMQFIDLGLVPEFGASYFVPERFGYLRAAELILLGETFDARQAAEVGLVTRVVPDEKVLATAIEIAQQLAEKPFGALRACKKLMKRHMREKVEQAVKVENETFFGRLYSTEAKEAISAYVKKRSPDFT